jgi:transposase
MGAAVELRQDFGAEDLRRFAARARTGAQARRLLALAAVLDGMNRAEAARIGGMDRQTLRDWVHRFNQHGPDGLIDIKPVGCRPRLSDEQKQILKQLVEDGPDPDTDGVVRWRCVDLKRVVRDRFGIDLSEVSLGRVLKQLGFSRISARPRHPMQDPEAIATFKKTSPQWSRRS